MVTRSVVQFWQVELCQFLSMNMTMESLALTATNPRSVEIANISLMRGQVPQLIEHSSCSCNADRTI
jgi:hypothetical protein